MGFPSIGTIGLGLSAVSSEIRVPNPPARITTFNVWLQEVSELNQSCNQAFR
jgi:hypothetical protein